MNEMTRYIAIDGLAKSAASPIGSPAARSGVGLRPDILHAVPKSPTTNDQVRGVVDGNYDPRARPMPASQMAPQQRALLSWGAKKMVNDRPVRGANAPLEATFSGRSNRAPYKYQGNTLRGKLGRGLDFFNQTNYYSPVNRAARWATGQDPSPSSPLPPSTADMYPKAPRPGYPSAIMTR